MFQETTKGNLSRENTKRKRRYPTGARLDPTHKLKTEKKDAVTLKQRENVSGVT